MLQNGAHISETTTTTVSVTVRVFCFVKYTNHLDNLECICIIEEVALNHVSYKLMSTTETMGGWVLC